jgi:hypothetical protein
MGFHLNGMLHIEVCFGSKLFPLSETVDLRVPETDALQMLVLPVRTLTYLEPPSSFHPSFGAGTTGK